MTRIICRPCCEFMIWIMGALAIRRYLQAREIESLLYGRWTMARSFDLEATHGIASPDLRTAAAGRPDPDRTDPRRQRGPRRAPGVGRCEHLGGGGRGSGVAERSLCLSRPGQAHVRKAMCVLSRKG